MKKFALVALFAAAGASCAQAATTISFIGNTGNGGSAGTLTVTNNSGAYDYDAGIDTVSGSLTFDLSALQGANLAIAPAIDYEGRAFSGGTFTSTGTTPTIFTAGNAGDSITSDPDPDFGTAQLSFVRTIDLDNNSTRNLTYTFYSQAPVTTMTVDGVLLPDFSSTDIGQLFFTISDSTGTFSDYVEHFSIGQVTSFSVTTTSDVPEPASWAMMVAGFGLAGAAIRRRKVAFAL